MNVYNGAQNGFGTFRGTGDALTLVPAGMLTVETPVPERPLTLHVRSVEVTSVTGLLFGGIRM